MGLRGRAGAAALADPVGERTVVRVSPGSPWALAAVDQAIETFTPAPLPDQPLRGTGDASDTQATVWDLAVSEKGKAELEHIVTKVLEQHAGDGEKAGESVEESESSRSPNEPQAIETAESALNLVLMPRYKGLHGVVSADFHLPLVAADRPRCVFRLLLKPFPQSARFSGERVPEFLRLVSSLVSQDLGHSQPYVNPQITLE
jgi:hypothetical protein